MLKTGEEEAGDEMLGGGTSEGEGPRRVRGLVWGWIGAFLRVFSCRKLLCYSAVARLHPGVRGRDGGISAWWGRVVDGDGAGFGHGKGHQWTLFAWIYAQFGLGRAGRSASGEWRSTAQWWMRNVQGMRERLKCIGHGPRGDLEWVDIGSFRADERWGECQRATQRRVRVARLYALEWGPAATVRCAGF